MVEILLILLKILGFTILFLLLFILLLIIAVFILPVSYQIMAKYQEEPEVCVRLRWTGIEIKGIYEQNEFKYYIRSFGVMVSTNDRLNPHYREDMELKVRSSKDQDDDFDEYMRKRELEDEEREEQSQTVTSKVKHTQKQEIKQPAEPAEQEGEAAVPKTTWAPWIKLHDKLQQIVEGITSIPMRIHYAIGKILSRILDFLVNINENVTMLQKKKDHIIKKVRKYKLLLEKDYTKQSFRNLKKLGLGLIKHIRPRKIKGNIQFGFADPATTGQALAAAAVCMPLYKNQIQIMPNFQEEIFAGELMMKGRGQFAYIIALCIRYMVNKDMYKTVRALMKINHVGK